MTKRGRWTCGWLVGRRPVRGGGGTVRKKVVRGTYIQWTKLTNDLLYYGQCNRFFNQCSPMIRDHAVQLISKREIAGDQVAEGAKG